MTSGSTVSSTPSSCTALAYILTEPELQAVFETAFVHCRRAERGLRPRLRQRAIRASHESRRPRFRRPVARAGYVEWVRLDPSDQMRHVVDFAYLIREGDIRVEQDRHVCGLFLETWLCLKEPEFDVDVVEPDYEGAAGQLVFACRRRD